MTKKSKLTEKAVRTPDLDEGKKEHAISAYRASVQEINTESAISHRFTMLLQSLFGVQPGFIEEYVKGIEKFVKVKEKDRIFRGRADQLSGNLIIEFEKDISSSAKSDEAKRQLRQYTACAWSQEKPDQRTRFVCLATDGRRFRVYAPVAGKASDQTIDPDSINLNPLEDLDAAKVRWEDFYFFLDRYLLRKEILHPTSEHIVKDFGPNSHAFQVAEASLLQRWHALKGHPDYAVLYEAWDKYLRIVYGSALADDELFVRHTYLASLAKLMVWSRLVAPAQTPADQEVAALLEGSYFKEQLGIENFLEEDFFSWVARPEARQLALDIARILLELLRNYNLRELSEDVLKGLYEGLVDPATRHDLGEYYTPDWLAHRIVRKFLETNAQASVLDPACGSATFLYMTIREKRRLLGNSARTLEHILSDVVGMDIHPLACIVAKANYVLALGDLMAKRKQRIAIPIYLANSIRPPEFETHRQLWQQVNCYKTDIDGRPVHIPEEVVRDSARYDRAIDAVRDFAVHSKGKKADFNSFANFLQAQYPGLVHDDRSARILYSVAETLKDMIEHDRDTIWAFVLKNIYKPLFLKERFDLIVGNPPWLSYRYVERSDYQKILKEQITEVYGLVVGRAELITHLELGTLFLVRSADLYLKNEGSIAFVLPKSIFSADQHDALRRQNVRRVHVRPVDLWDLEDVAPLFNISSAVYFGEKRPGPRAQSVPGLILSGELPLRNAALDAADADLAVEPVEFHLSTMGKRTFWSKGGKVDLVESPYRRLFRQGATIVPRCFWFVDLKKHDLGFNQDLPPLISSERAQEEAKKAYQGCVIEGPVESRFIYATLLPVDMIPFGTLRLRPIVLPAIRKQDYFMLLTSEQARSSGYMHLAQWLDKVEGEWKKRGGAKAKRINSIGWLDYRKKLSQQNPNASIWVIYATSGTHVCACVITKKDLHKTPGHGLSPCGMAVDYTTYFMECEENNQSFYLSSVLNAPSVNVALKPAQAKGLWGARHICKKVLDLPIPRFDPKRKEHLRLAEIGEACAKRVEQWVASGGPGQIKSIGLLRQKVRQMLSGELAEIDSIVKPMLGL